MHKKSSSFFTIIQFILLINTTMQSQFRLGIMAVKAIGKTIKSPLFKKIGNTIKKPIIRVFTKAINKPIGMCHQNKNTVKYLGKEAIKNLKQTAPWAVREGKSLMKIKSKKNIYMGSVTQLSGKRLMPMIKRSTGYMHGKELGLLLKMVSKSKPYLPFFVGGGLMRLIKLGLTYDDGGDGDYDFGGEPLGSDDSGYGNDYGGYTDDGNYVPHGGEPIQSDNSGFGNTFGGSDNKGFGLTFAGSDNSAFGNAFGGIDQRNTKEKVANPKTIPEIITVKKSPTKTLKNKKKKVKDKKVAKKEKFEYVKDKKVVKKEKFEYVKGKKVVKKEKEEYVHIEKDPENSALFGGGDVESSNSSFGMSFGDLDLSSLSKTPEDIQHTTKSVKNPPKSRKNRELEKKKIREAQKEKQKGRKLEWFKKNKTVTKPEADITLDLKTRDQPELKLKDGTVKVGEKIIKKRRRRYNWDKDICVQKLDKCHDWLSDMTYNHSSKPLGIVDSSNYHLKSKKIILGLGNPGKPYEKTRRNVGLMLLDYLAKRQNIEFEHNAGLVASETPGAIYLRSNNLVSKSGKVLKKFMKINMLYYSHNYLRENLYIAQDYMDRKMGSWIMKKGGQARQHSGIVHIHKELGGFKSQRRICIGIGKSPDNRDFQQVTKYLLGKISTMDEKMQQEVVFPDIYNTLNKLEIMEKTDKDDEISDKNDEISDKNAEISDKNDEIVDKNDKIVDKNDEKSDKTDEKSDKNEEKSDKNHEKSDKTEEKSYKDKRSKKEHRKNLIKIINK